MSANLQSFDCTSFEGAEKHLGNRNGRKLGYNTRLIRRDENAIAVQYHFTDVVTFHRDYATLVANGWETTTTLQRLNAYMPIGRLYQENFTWYVAAYGETVEFSDGLRLPYPGNGARFSFRQWCEHDKRASDDNEARRWLWGDLHTLRNCYDTADSSPEYVAYQAKMLATFHKTRKPRKPRKLRGALSLHKAEMKREAKRKAQWAAWEARRDARKAQREA